MRLPPLRASIVLANDGTQVINKGPAIVLAADNNYTLAMGVVIQSILDHATRQLRFYLLADGISGENRRRVERLVAQSGSAASLEWLEPDLGEVADLHLIEGRHLSRAAFLRLLIPALLQPREARVIYLDCDVLVRADLGPLWHTDLAGRPMAAVRDCFVTHIGHDHGIRRHRALNLNPALPYFNSGVLLMDLRQFAEQRLGEAVAQYLRSHAEALNFHDQEGLNAVLAGRWLPLDATWNVSSEILDLPWWEPGELRQSLAPRGEELLRQGQIMHFTGRLKPWTAACQHPLKPLWWQTYARTGWHAPAAAAL